MTIITGVQLIFRISVFHNYMDRCDGNWRAVAVVLLLGYHL